MGSPVEWTRFTVQVPPIAGGGRPLNWEFSGRHDEIWPEVRRLVRAYRAIGVEPAVTRPGEPVSVPL